MISVSDILELAGFAFLSVAAFMVGIPLGLAAVGVSLLLFGLSFADKDES